MIKWLRRTERDFEEVEKYISQDDPRAAVDRLGHLIGRVGRFDGTKELVIDGTPYIAPYRKKGEQIEILWVYHLARL